MPKRWRAHHAGRASFDAWERVRESVIGYARSREAMPRDIEGVPVQVEYHTDGSRTWLVNGEALPPGVNLTFIVRAVVYHASKAGGEPLT